MGEDPEALVSAIRDRAFTLPRVFCHRLRDGVVEAEVERLKLFPGHEHVLMNGQLGDRLTDISVGVDDLRDRESQAKQLAAVTAGGLADLLVVDHVARLRQA